MTPIVPARDRQIRRDHQTYRDRQTQEILTEAVLGGKTIRWLYHDGLGRLLLDLAINRHWFCQAYAAHQESRASRRRIRPFIEQYGIDLAEAELPIYQYRSFNAFFSRRLLPGARSFVEAPDRLACPCDAKVLVYPQLESGIRIPVKRRQLTVEGLLSSGADALPYRGGSAAILRLAPHDYHRFHFFDAAEASAAREVPGRYHSVSPIALDRQPAAYCLNKRMVTRLDTAHFGRVAMIEVGALCVGSIVQTYRAGPVRRGQEKGYFQFGGSTVVLLFEPGRVEFDADLIRDSQAGLEVRVLTGSALGKAISTVGGSAAGALAGQGHGASELGGTARS